MTVIYDNKCVELLIEADESIITRDSHSLIVIPVAIYLVLLD
jgi:hypothetical protein